MPRSSYTPNFANGRYIKDYETMQKQLDFGKFDKCVNLTPTEWANGYTIYAFKSLTAQLAVALKVLDRGQLPVLFDLKLAFLRRKTRISK